MGPADAGRAMTTVNTLWIGDSVSPMERACIQSFLDKGFDYHLYCYRPIANVPPGCQLLDAGKVLPESRIIRYTRGPGKGSVALFANMFRYKLLYESGGWWVDTDMFCLTQALPDAGVVLSQEDAQGLNNAIMRFPPGHALLQAGYEACMAQGEDAEWGDTGPRLLTRLTAEFDLSGSVFAPEVFYPLSYRQFWFVFDPRRTAYAAERIRGAATIHLWNNMLSRSSLDKNVLPPDGSLLRNLYEWTIGFADFDREYVLDPSSGVDAMDLRIVSR